MIYRKPDSRIFQLALEALELKLGEVMMVGDAPNTDIICSHNLGMITVRLMRGPNRTKPDLVKLLHKIRNISNNNLI